MLSLVVYNSEKRLRLVRRSARSLMPSIILRSITKCAGSKTRKSKSISGKLALVPGPAAHQQASAIAMQRTKMKRPASITSGNAVGEAFRIFRHHQSHRAIRLHGSDDHAPASAVAFGIGEPHRVADAAFALILRDDLVSVPHVGEEEILQPRIAIETAAILAKLGQPFPDDFDGCVNRDRASGAITTVWGEFVPVSAMRLSSSEAPQLISHGRKRMP